MVILGNEVLAVDLDGLVVPVQTDEPALHLVQDGGGRPQEGPLHILLTLGRCLDVQHFVVPRQLQGVAPTHHPLVDQVALVADQHQYHISVTVAAHIFDPPGCISEGLPPCHVEHHQSSGTGAVVGASYRPELLLSRRVPNLQLDGLAVEQHCFGCELDSDCELVVGVEPIFNEAAYEAGFADANKMA